MLPPIDPAILSANPKFNALYSDLCNNKLNADGTSQLDAKAQRDHDALSQVRGDTFPANHATSYSKQSSRQDGD